jgi:hypothetical protein
MRPGGNAANFHDALRLERGGRRRNVRVEAGTGSVEGFPIVVEKLPILRVSEIEAWRFS